MGKLIDTTALRDMIYERHYDEVLSACALGLLETLIIKQPEAVTRCRHCKFGIRGGTYGGHLMVICERKGEQAVIRDGDGYCSDGRPREGEDIDD